jgi:hypothetical protein
MSDNQICPVDTSPQSQGLWASLTTKIINNLQVTVKNIHVRYEDKISVPGVSTDMRSTCRYLDNRLQHPFAAGITLAGFTARSVNEKWEPAFIESTAGAIHKVCGVFNTTNHHSLSHSWRTSNHWLFTLTLILKAWLACYCTKPRQSSWLW